MVANFSRLGSGLSASSILFVARLAGALIALITQITLARIMPARELGLFFFATSMASVLAVIAAAGYPQAATRFLPRYLVAARDKMLGAFYRVARRDISVFAIGLAATAAIGTAFVADRDTAIAVGVGGVAVPFLAQTLLIGSVANVESRFLLASLPEFLLRPIGMLSVVGLMVWVDVPANVLNLLAVFATLCLGVTIIQLVGLNRIRIGLHNDIRVSRLRTRLWRLTAMPLVTVSLFTALFADVAIVLASPFMPHDDLAVLAIGLKISLLVGFSIQVVHQTLMPKLARDLHSNRDVNAMGRVHRANLVIAGVIFAATLSVCAVGDKVLALFDPSFASAHGVLVILVASQGVRALAGPASQMLTVVGRQKLVIIACPLALALLSISNAILIPLYGMTGAAGAILLTITAWSAGLAYALAHTTGLRSYLNVSALWRGEDWTPRYASRVPASRTRVGDS